MARHCSQTHTFVTVFTVVTLSAICQGLECYSCHLEPERNFCTDANFLLQERQKNSQSEVSDYIRNCTYGNFHNACVIETIIDTEKSLKLMYRDCSDGKNFVTNVTNTRLARIGDSPDNNTHCAYKHEILASVCISICTTDLCNGPKLPSNAAIIGWYHCLVLMMSAIASLLCFERF